MRQQKKRFNDTGLCVPHKHYMVDISPKIREITAMIEKGDYFVINRPRQYGKTTTFYMLSRFLRETREYFPIRISFEGLSSENYKSESKFIDAFLLQLKTAFKTLDSQALEAYIEADPVMDSLDKLGFWLTGLVEQIGKKTVLMIDEVDKSSNNQLFLDFLGMLRDKYLRAIEDVDITFHSVILAGVHDVKSLKLKLRPEDEAKYNSPWNIAADFTLEMSFNPDEIATMLQEYIEATGAAVDIKEIAGQLHYYTSGYPFLVSKLCKIIDEGEVPALQWNKSDIETAVNKLLASTNTNFDNVIKNLENNEELYQLVEKVVLYGERIEFNRYSSTIDTGVMHGIFKQEGHYVDIHNRIYKQLIYNYMTTNYRLKEMLEPGASEFTFKDNYILKGGGLDVEEILLKFQAFMKKEYSRRDM